MVNSVLFILIFGHLCSVNGQTFFNKGKWSTVLIATLQKTVWTSNSRLSNSVIIQLQKWNKVFLIFLMPVWPFLSSNKRPVIFRFRRHGRKRNYTKIVFCWSFCPNKKIEWPYENRDTFLKKHIVIYKVKLKTLNIT